jgi:putative transposase
MRKPRRKKEHATYHVVARANRGEFILNSSFMKEMMLTVLEEAKEKYGYDLKHFCIMSNHVHLMIQPKPNTDLSKIMQWVLSVFAARFNRFFGLKGHVWYDRFKSSIIETLRQFFKTFRYISENPVKAHICNDIREYQYSGIYYYRYRKGKLMGT